MFHFRRRVPSRLRERGARAFLALSLSTELPFQAARRAEALLAALERAERNVDARAELTGAEIDAILTEVARSALARMLAQQDDDARTEDDADARIAALEERIAVLWSAARKRDYQLIEPELGRAADTLSIDLPTPVPSSLGRPAAGLMRELAEAEILAEEGEDVTRAAEPIVARHFNGDVRAFAAAPVLFSTAFERTAAAAASPDMRRNTEATGKLFLELMGDRPIAALGTAVMEDFLHLVSRLPKTHGKGHGRNRHAKIGKEIDKRAEIAEADAADEAATEPLRDRDDLPMAEKRARLSALLVPRVTMTTVRRHRDALNRIVKTAVEKLGAAQRDAVPSYKRLDELIREKAPEDALYIRVTQPKTRMPWSQERLQALLTSPIYAGCASPHRRWKPGACIIRDATYWVPLMIMTMGTRIEEVLILKRRNVIRRNGVHCFVLGCDPDQSAKTEDSERVVPIPQLLLDLGFVEWVRETAGTDALLFPCAARRSAGATLSAAFGKHLRHLLGKLGLADFDEDFYALRKTLSTELARLDVADGRRQAIAGHKGGAIINRHYTAHHAADLKRELDRVDLCVEVAHSERHRFPVIAECHLAAGATVDVDVALGDDLGACAVRLTGPDGAELLAARVRDAGPVPAEWAGAPLLELGTVLARLRAILADARPRPPRDRQRRRAFENLWAMA